MRILLDILFILFAIILLIGFVHYFRLRRIATSRILNLLNALAAGQYSRRVDATIPGPAGELAKATNALAEKLQARAAQAQLDSNHLLSLLAVLDHSDEIALATDSANIIRLANPMAARVLDKPIDQLLGKPIHTVIQNPDLLALHKNAFHSQKPITAQIILNNKGGGLHCQTTAATIYAGSLYCGTLLLLRDITEIARTLQIKSDFATNASHELRTPLASIRAAVETMQTSEDHQTTQKCIHIIDTHSQRLQLIITDLLDLSRTEDPKATTRRDAIHLPTLCDHLISMYVQTAAEKKIALQIDLAHDAQTLRGDERLLTLILKNLLENALKFTTTGSITIRSYLSETTPPTLILEVQDTGCGIPPESQSRVFERFYTVNRSRGGSHRSTGLGLAIAKHAATAMNAQISLTSELHKGTTLRCSFPMTI